MTLNSVVFAELVDGLDCWLPLMTRHRELRPGYEVQVQADVEQFRAWASRCETALTHDSMVRHRLELASVSCGMKSGDYVGHR